jgi:hypothetical protein
VQPQQRARPEAAVALPITVAMTCLLENRRKKSERVPARRVVRARRRLDPTAVRLADWRAAGEPNAERLSLQHVTWPGACQIRARCGGRHRLFRGLWRIIGMTPDSDQPPTVVTGQGLVPAESEGFEPSARGYLATVFKTVPLGRSGSSPRHRSARGRPGDPALRDLLMSRPLVGSE